MCTMSDAAWDKAINTIRTNRCRFTLKSSDGSFCALGAIGDATMGEQFDPLYLKKETGAYAQLEDDEDAQRMVHLLADTIREQHPRHIYGLKRGLRDVSHDDQAVVFTFNDLIDEDDEDGIEELVRMFEKAKIRDQEMIREL